jgi:hypothetical protein
MRDISNWFEARSTDQDSVGIRRYLDKVICRLMGAPSDQQADARVAPAVATVQDSAHPDEHTNSL